MLCYRIKIRDSFASPPNHTLYCKLWWTVAPIRFHRDCIFWSRVYLSVSPLLLLSFKISEHQHVLVYNHTPLRRFYHLSCYPKACLLYTSVDVMVGTGRKQHFLPPKSTLLNFTHHRTSCFVAGRVTRACGGTVASVRCHTQVQSSKNFVEVQIL